jgi:hypothetical protein
MKMRFVVVFAVLVCLAACSAAQSVASFHIDATAAAPAPETGFLLMGGVSPAGHRIAADSRSLTLDGKPWLPVMGEFHFSRYPAQYWQEELEKMKAGGVSVVAAYVFWIHHEEVEGQFDWTGQRDLHRFVELCRKTGLQVYLRIGPWDHGEARNGGFPDWLLQKKIPLRRNDPEYLKYVGRFYNQLDLQITGQLWQQGGPIVGVQLENEYGEDGPGAGAEHIAELKRLALDAGIAPPLFSITGWPQNSFPPREFIPFFGGYPDDFWTSELKDHAPNPVYLFAANRAVGDMGAMAAAAQSGKTDLRHYPYMTTEQGGGMETSYRRRPLIDAADISALTLTGLGSGANLYGYYMFHGGANPQGKLSTLQESTATHYPNDLPIVSYDFQAPLGQYGQQRASFRKTKSLHLFVQTAGADLAAMAPYAPDRRPKDAADLSMPRMMFRASGDRGFLFVNNYVRKYTMAARPGFQVQVKLPSGTVALPNEPVELPADTSVVWPVNLDLGAGTLVDSTAQLLTRMEIGSEPTWFFFALPGLAPEFVFDRRDVSAVGSALGAVTVRNNQLLLQCSAVGAGKSFQVDGKNGNHARIVVLTQAEAENFWKLSVGGRDAAILTEADVFAAPDGVHLRSTDLKRLTVAQFVAGGPAHPGQLLLARQSWKIAPAKVDFTWTKTREATERAALRMEPLQSGGRPQAVAPADADFSGAAAWALSIPAQPMSGISDLWLRIHYTGDVARLSLDGRLLDDDFYNGRVWEIGLKRFLPEAFGRKLEVAVLPLPPAAPIYLDQRARAAEAALPAQVGSVELLPEYEVVFQPEPTQKPL